MKTERFKLNEGFVAIPIPESYRDCMALIKTDNCRISGRMEPFLKIAGKNLRPFGSSVLFWFRLCQYKGFLYPLFKFLYKKNALKKQIDIPTTTKIGAGLYIGHGMCMVINRDTIIGNNVNLSQFLNVGTNHGTPAIIGDNVYVGPQVCIVEHVEIGSNSTIGAGAVVTKNVPENATVAGVPAKILNFSNPGRYVNKRVAIFENSK